MIEFFQLTRVLIRPELSAYSAGGGGGAGTGFTSPSAVSNAGDRI